MIDAGIGPPPPLSAGAGSTGKSLRVAWWVLLAAAVGVTLLIRIQLLGIPLERDEGEYAYAGQLLLQGVSPYQEAYNMKFPGTYAAYAVIMALFGQTTAAIHLGLLLVNAATVALLFVLGRRLLGFAAAVAAAASYAVLSVSPAVLGFAGHATHFVMLMVLGGLVILLRNGQAGNQSLLLGGMLLGIGVLMKQPGAAFVPLGVGLVCYRDRRSGLPPRAILKRAGLLLAAAVLPFALTCLALWSAGVFDKFWFWTVSYAREYGTLISFTQGMQTFVKAIKQVVASAWALWILAGAGLVAGLCNKALRPKTIMLLAFLAVSAAAVSAGLYFRRHYFILALPVVSLLIGAAVAWTGTFRLPLVRSFTWLVVAGALASAVFAERAFLFETNPETASRLAYGRNPFPEAVRIAEFLRERTAPEDKIAIIGSEPQIYFHSQRRSATGHIYLYGLMEPHQYAARMQREMIQEIEAANPKFLVVVAVDASWLARRDSEKLIFEWMNESIVAKFQLVGLADMGSREETEYYLPAPADMATEIPQNSIVVYERK